MYTATFFNHFCTSGHCSFLKDPSLTFIDKINQSDLLRREEYLEEEARLRLWDHLGLDGLKSPGVL